ncbi:hypothetical protein AN401_07280 [Zobellella denitrificans]|uniref:Bacteriophage phiJL001 Gp84 C-terminal domain-containing protein n=1 Tax=Zobellella denitrificans TaxID=347534 RepID=A0A291HNG7_9GAMM|nr:phage BR0599 family protein [Zobellella denitrificans]ATG73685.1 hypothetical protein AN401_07280 [Zobellella denitrificans]
MAFNDYEQSRHDARPAELYEFRFGDAAEQIFRLTSADHDVTVAGVTYTSLMIRRSDIEQDGNPDDDDGLTLTLPYHNDIAELYRGAPLDQRMSLRVRVVHLDDPTLQLRHVWSGRLVDVAWLYPDCELSAERMGTALRRTGLRLRFTHQCRHLHYGRWCWLNRADWGSSAEVVAVDGLTVTLAYTGHAANVPATIPGDWFLGGMMELDGLLRYVISQGTAGDNLVLTLSRPMPQLDEAAIVELFPGCDRSHAMCKGRYGNDINYGGFRHSPKGKGPFERGLV